MTDVFLDFMLGPMRGIGTFYYEHQMIFNSIVVGVAAFALFSKRKAKQPKEQA
ncbi:hypothetical protein JCM19046_4809 [Bacillus sp. JCM 19046]|nr:hypothetical protein JCM19045_422 [Bacillus sp. JCM 19045]GAF20106.1 hypothetical protein JCM19046_4809 [Bacillus sp. JCM 19046]